MNNLATIILPTYNGQKYICQMLDSIYYQDYRPIEVIISDDASTDKTVPVIKRWLKNKNTEDITFKVICNAKNIRLSGNLSRAAKHVHGKYLFLADQDDIWQKNKVSAQIDYLEAHDECIMCICDKAIINKENKVLCKSYFKYLHSVPAKKNYREVLNSGSNLWAANCICLRTGHLDKIFPVPDEICEQDTFITIMAAHFGEIGFLKEVLTLYRIYENNLSGSYALETNRNLFKAAYIICKRYKRSNWKEKIDPHIIKRELKQRFGETNVKFSQALYSGTEKNIYWATIKYMIDRRSNWKLFCQTKKKNVNTMKGYADKHLALFLMMNQWVKVKQKGKNVAEYLEKRGYKKIAIYGMSYAGETLVDELKGTDIQVVYGLDKNAASIYSDVVILTMDDSLVEVDAVVVTAIFFFDEIMQSLAQKLDCPIISLEDILYEI